MNAVTFPKQVQAEIDAAERIEQAMTAQPEPQTPGADGPDAQADAHSPAPAQPQEPTAPVTQPRAPDDDPAVWRARYATLEGKYRAEVPALHQEMRVLRQAYEDLQKAQTALKQDAETPPKPKETSLVTAEDAKTFGADLIDLARRVAQEELRALTVRVTALEQLAHSAMAKASRVEAVEGTLVRSQEEAFWDKLTAAVPDWKTVNADSAWLEWLKEYDPIAGKPRNDALQDAHRAMDAQRVAALFNLFKSTLPVAPDKASAQSELARSVAPPKSAKATQPQAARKNFTGKDYAYWTDPRRVHDTPRAQVEAMLTELETALREGRVAW